MILLDAFSQAYLSKDITPYLYSLAEDGYSTTVDPVFAYRGIETTMFTGVWPDVHKSWTEFKLADNVKKNMKIRLLQSLIRVLDVLPTDGLRAKSRFFVERYLFKRIHKSPNVMPYAAIPYFESTQLKETFENGSVNNITTMFDVFRKENIPYVCIEPWVRGDRGVLGKAKEMIGKLGGEGFCYIKFSHLDHLGHKFGPEPLLFKDQLANIDTYVEEIVTLMKTKNTNLSVLIIADHGMSKVLQTVNIFDYLNQLQSTLYEDYIVFVDSTIIRFWFFTENALHEVSSMLSKMKCGHSLSIEERRFLNIPLSPEFGELIFVLDEGLIAHPSFFSQKSKINGMHGYAYSETYESRPIMIANGQIADLVPRNHPVKFIDLSHFILRSFIPYFEQANYGLLSYLSLSKASSSKSFS